MLHVQDNSLVVYISSVCLYIVQLLSLHVRLFEHLLLFSGKDQPPDILCIR